MIFAVVLILLTSLLLILGLVFFGLRQPALQPSFLVGAFPFMQPDFFHGITSKFNESHIPDLTSRVVLITGANSGLGFANSKFIAKNGATLIMACRNIEKGEQAKREIVKLTNADPDKIIIMRLDLGDLSSVKLFAREFKERFTDLHHLILNAGKVGVDKEYALTKEGIEEVFGVNHVGHFYLTMSLIDHLSPIGEVLPTIITLSSGAHWNATSLLLPEKPFKSEKLLDKINDPVAALGLHHYDVTKAASVMFAKELARRHPYILVNSVHPGVVLTPMLSQIFTAPVADFIERFLADRFAYLPDTAVMTQVYAAVGNEIQEKKLTGRYFIPNAEESETSELVKDNQLQRDLWEFTEQLLEVKGFM